MNFAIALEGRANIEAALDLLFAKATGVSLDALEAGAKLVAEEARNRVPVAAVHRSKYAWGTRAERMRETISAKRHEASNSASVWADFPSFFIERGTATMAPRPFIEPALEAKRAEILALVMDLI